MNGDCNICINGKLPSYSASCVECGLLRKNYKPVSNADRIRQMTDEELAHFMTPENYKFPCPPNHNDCQYELIPCWMCWARWLKATADKEETE